MLLGWLPYWSGWRVKPTRNDKRRQGGPFPADNLDIQTYPDSRMECQELELQEVLKAKAQFVSTISDGLKRSENQFLLCMVGGSRWFMESLYSLFCGWTFSTNDDGIWWVCSHFGLPGCCSPTCLSGSCRDAAEGRESGERSLGGLVAVAIRVTDIKSWKCHGPIVKKARRVPNLQE